MCLLVQLNVKAQEYLTLLRGKTKTLRKLFSEGMKNLGNGRFEAGEVDAGGSRGRGSGAQRIAVAAWPWQVKVIMCGCGNTKA